MGAAWDRPWVWWEPVASWRSCQQNWHWGCSLSHPTGTSPRALGAAGAGAGAASVGGAVEDSEDRLLSTATRHSSSTLVLRSRENKTGRWVGFEGNVYFSCRQHNRICPHACSRKPPAYLCSRWRRSCRKMRMGYRKAGWTGRLQAGCWLLGRRCNWRMGRWLAVPPL